VSKRTDQADSLIQNKLSQIISREVEFPQGVLVTITKAEVSGDLKHAKIWIACTPEDKTGVVYGKLRDQAKELKQLLGAELDLQFVPHLQFRVDKSAMAVEEVERLLEEINSEDN